MDAVFKESAPGTFPPPELEEFAQTDAPLPIAENQTISQPHVVAMMLAGDVTASSA